MFTKAWRNCALVVSKSLLFAVVLLAGCVPVHEESMLAPTKEWRGVQSTWDEFTGWREWFPHRDRTARHNKRHACVQEGTETRVVTQNGINDSVVYQRCYNTPPTVAVGQRLDGR